MASPTQARAVITGASSGIGAVYAHRLANRGYPLLLMARRGERLQELAVDLGSRYGSEVETLVVDLADDDGVRRAEQALSARPLAVLVNNAGAGGLGPMSQVAADELERLIKLNVVALTRLSHAALASFREAGSGVLINIASVMAFLPSATGAAYSGSKAFVLNFTRSLALEYEGSGVRVQVVMPGPTRTEFFTSQGLSDTVFPDSSFLTAAQLVDAALVGLDAGEVVTTPSLPSLEVWEALEAARGRFMAGVGSGQVAARYLASTAPPGQDLVHS
jgi:short-subunit dehydrogenase